MNLSGKLVLFLFLCILLVGNPAWGGFKFKYNEQTKGEIGIWAQVWYQYVEDGQDSNGDGVGDKGLNDFMIRRV